jgi:hypothetical protein
MEDLQLLHVSLRVAGLVRVSKDRTVYEIPYSGGKNAMKMEGKIPPASKEALAEIVKGFGGKVSYEPDGLKLEFPNKKAIEGWGEVQDLFKLDKKLRSLFDMKKKAEYPDDVNEAVIQPKDRKPAEKPAAKAPAAKEPAAKAPAREPAKPAGKPQPSGRRRPGPPPKAKFLKSLDRMSEVVRQSEDQSEIVEAVEDFLDGIRYDSWPETA